MEKKRYKFLVNARGKEISVGLSQGEANTWGGEWLRRPRRIEAKEHSFGEERCNGELGSRSFVPTGVTMVEAAGPKGIVLEVGGVEGMVRARCRSCGQGFVFDGASNRWRLAG